MLGQRYSNVPVGPGARIRRINSKYETAVLSPLTLVEVVTESADQKTFIDVNFDQALVIHTARISHNSSTRALYALGLNSNPGARAERIR